MGGKSGGGGGGNTVTTTKADPWTGQQPYLQGGYSNGPGTPIVNGILPQAAALYSSGQLSPNYFPGQTVAGQSPQTQQAISQLTNTANSGQQQGISNAANQQVTSTLNGAYADPATNPYFQGAENNIADAYARGTAAQTDASFNNAGGYGGSAYNETKHSQNQAFADSLNNLGNTQYQQNRTNQLQAAALAPGTSNMPYSNIAQLANAGSTQDAFNQNQINANMARYNYTANQPYNALTNYGQLVGGNYGSSQTQSSPYYQNSGANALGGAISGGLGGAGLFNAFPATLGGLGLSAGSAGGLGAAAGGLLGFLSDIRAKDKIIFIGFENGFPVYDFNYKNDNKRYRGVMAQDLVRLKPEALGERDGLFTVDYGKIGIPFREAA